MKEITQKQARQVKRYSGNKWALCLIPGKGKKKGRAQALVPPGRVATAPASATLLTGTKEELLAEVENRGADNVIPGHRGKGDDQGRGNRGKDEKGNRAKDGKGNNNARNN